MNKISKQNISLALLMALLTISTNLYAEQNTHSTITTTIGTTLNTFNIIEGTKFSVLVSADDLNKGRVITLCEEANCEAVKASYDATTLVDLPNNKKGTTRDLLNFSKQRADIIIRKIDQHIHQIGLYK